LVVFSIGRLPADTLLIRNGTVVDGTGAKPRKADVRIDGDRILEIGKLRPKPGEETIDAKGLVVAPGFIDTHGHALTKPGPLTALTVSQGITTAIIGQDGGHNYPLTSAISTFEKTPTPYNMASFVGHGTIRKLVMGENDKRRGTGEEVAKMAALVEEEMKAGGLGLSTGLEYDPGYYAATDELIVCAKAAARFGGIYISHMRNEDNTMLEALDELVRIGRAAGCPAQVSHIKLGSKAVWGRSREVLKRLETVLDVTADVYPYLYWQSSITVLIPTRDWNDRNAWQKGLDDVGGPKNVLLGTFEPDPAWAGKTIAELSAMTGKDPVTVIQEIVKRTRGSGERRTESVVVTAMREDDLRAFLRHPLVMICTDGSPGGAHPRAAGTYPRVLGRYVREKHVLTLQEAIRKMTSLPAYRMGFSDRGRLLAGYKADIVLFDPKTVIDRATTEEPQKLSVGIRDVFVNGVAVVRNGTATTATPGRFLRRAAP
jgi:N-acyl-D-amino-acid deacylase